MTADEPEAGDPGSDYARLGEQAGIAAHIDAFVDRVASDWVIGFLFEGRDLARIKRHETSLACMHRGGPAAYSGRPLGAVHQPLRINRGHFRRRLAILRTVLSERGVPDDIVDRWIRHEQRLEPAIVDGTDCAPDEVP